MGPKEYLMYYFNIISAIRFLISYWPFAQYMAYTPVQRYSTNKPDKPEVNEENNQIYREIHTADV